MMIAEDGDSGAGAPWGNVASVGYYNLSWGPGQANDSAGNPWYSLNYLNAIYTAGRPVQRHVNGFNVAYCDGHVKFSVLPGMFSQYPPLAPEWSIH
jgi:prepilin-type processing-associated H-X9-DG protein